MNFLLLNDNWRVVNGDDEGSNYINFPYDALIYRDRDCSKADGNRNGFYRSETLKVQKRIEFPLAKKIILEIEGAHSVVDVFIGADCVATITDPSKYFIDVDAYAGRTCTVTLVCVSSQHASSYTGLGLSGGIRLLTADSLLYIENDGVCVSTDSDSTRAELVCRVDIVNGGSVSRSFTALMQVFNARNRRVTKKARKFRLAANSKKSFYIPFKMVRHYDWSFSDAYLYSAEVLLSDNEQVFDSQSATFGIRHAELSQRNFIVSGRKTQLDGAVVSHDNGVIGMCSTSPAEIRKASVLKESGFNSVRYVGVPTENALDALDRSGLMCIVDLFDVLAQPKEVGDGHEFFYGNYERIIRSSVRTLRKHPCVIAYGLGDCPPESYGRGEGAALGKKIVELIKRYDDTRFLIASATEFIPTAEEMSALGVRADKLRMAHDDAALLSLAREKNIFRDMTASWFALADVAGYSYLYQRYQSDSLASSLRIIGTASRPDRAYEIAEETEKNGIIGDFVCPAIDGLGTGERGDGFRGARFSSDGDIDITLKRRPRSVYRRICMGARDKSVIVIPDPENEDDDVSVRDGWNLPRFLGKPVTVKVYTGGDVVALYLDGKLVGRKLAGKINRHVATFRVNYYPGRLEAVSFRKGLECSRCYTETASSPKSVKPVCLNKNISLSDGNMAFIEIVVVDKEGRESTRARRDIDVFVTGDGELYALSNADPELSLPASVKTLPVYDGRALAVVRGTREGKMTVKVTGEGLLSGKITVKVKP